MPQASKLLFQSVPRLACGALLYVVAGLAAAEPCYKIATDAELASYTRALGTDTTIAEDICYAEGTEWQERSKDRNVALDQRFDYYRPSSKAPADKLPLIIWAHPNGMSDNVSLQLYEQLVVPAIRMGFAFMSIEFRHPVSSQVIEPPPNLNVPNTDIARAVQWARHRSGLLGVDGSNIFLVGQSRGTLGLMNALSDNLADSDSPVPYLTKSSRVKAVYAVQAQTTYLRDQIKRVFIDDRDWTKFDEVYADFQQPGSAIHELTADDPPIAMRYSTAPTDPLLQNVVKLRLPARDGTCAYPEGCFDLHHPNFGLKLHLKFKALAGSPPASKFNIAYNVPPDDYFLDRGTNRPYTCFFAQNMTPEAQANLAPVYKQLCGLEAGALGSRSSR